MILKIVLCIACVQAVAVGVVSGKNLLVQPHHSGPSIADRGPLIARDGPHNAHHLSRPHHQGGHFSYPLSVRNGRHGGGRGSVSVCNLCPASHDIAPCLCQCLNNTAAMILCGPELSSCSQLTEVMSLTTYPVNAYLRLVVANTNLACKLEKDLWGSLVFQEIMITNNRFQALDNRAFQPFSATLTALHLDDNTLQDVYFATMSDTPLLRSLTLSNNAVRFLPGYSAMELPLLETFDASNNKIETILSETFAGMPKLRNIELSNNAITKVYTRAFTIHQHSATSLFVNLANNLITSIEPGVLEGVRVCSIDLRNNHLTILPEKVFRPIIDFTAAASEFLTNNNPFDCDSQFCWIATNETVNDTFDTVLCPNLDNDPVEVLTPMCIISGNNTSPQHSRRRPTVLPAHLPEPVPFRKSAAPRAVRNLRNPFLHRP